MTLSTKEVHEARKEGEVTIPIINAIKKIFDERKYGDLDKRLVAEKFINDLPDVKSLQMDEKTRLTKDYAPCAKLFEIIHKRLQKVAGEAQI